MHTVTGTPGGSPAHAARPAGSTTVWVSAAALLALAAGALAIVGALASAGPAPSAPSSAQSITVTPSGR